MKDFNLNTANNDEWLTPPEILRALGPFDLDPAAPVVRPWDMAARHYTKVDDGMAQPWEGRIWLNPPYGRETFRWLARLAEHGSGLALIFARTETQGFHAEIWHKAHAIFFFSWPSPLPLRQWRARRPGQRALVPGVLLRCRYGHAATGSRTRAPRGRPYQFEVNMKFPPKHYPNPGIQHTRAVVALTVVTMCLELFTPAPKSAMEKHMVKLRQWVNSCSEQTTRKRLSAGAKRALERCCDKLAPHVPTADTPDDARFTVWASLVWAAWLFTLDVKNTCPLFSDGRDGQRWRWLLHWLESLAEGLCQIDPRVDEQGTAIYETAAWALEGVEFQPESERRAA